GDSFSGGLNMHRLTGGVSKRFKALLAGCAVVGSAMIPSAGYAGTALTAEQALGKALFADASLSKNGTQSCASCHSSSSAFTDPDKSHPTSKGDNPSLFGPRNTPTAMYAAYSPTFQFDEGEGLWVGGQFLDGRAPTLEAQAKGPFVNHLEMGNSNPAEVVNKLKNGANAAQFKAVYGTTDFNDVDATYNKMASAIAAYERSPELSPFTSKYDYYLKGQVNLNLREQRGLAVFNDPNKGNCAACHISAASEDGTPPLFTDFTYDNIGIPKNYASDFLGLDAEHNPAGVDFSDLGLGGTVGDPDLYGAFKVSTLRNIDLTGPYGHNGWFATLADVIDFYATRDTKPVCADATVSSTQAEALGCWPAAEFADTMNVDELGNLPLTKRDKSDIAWFLRTLSDGYNISAVPEPATWISLIAGFGMIGAILRFKRRSAGVASGSAA
ncbi:MAG: cytochrome c peroxidase, partial [Sphingobium sp.]